MSRAGVGTIVQRQQNPDTGVKYETSALFGGIGLSLNRALGKQKRAMRKATANIRNKEANQIPIVWTEGCQEEVYDLRKPRNT